jgi:hypothetical protein
MSFANKLIGTGLAVLLVGISPAISQDTRLLGSARNVLIQSDVVFNKDRKFNSNATPFFLIYRSGLLKSFREVTISPDIIIKFHKDVFLLDQETISLTVFDAESNSIIYSEERKLVDEGNDVDRLVVHFLAKVKVERATRTAELAAELEKEKNLAKTERDSDALKDAKIILSIYSSSESLLQAIIDENRIKPNEYHVFLREESTEEKADVVLVEKLRQGSRVLILMSRDTKEILHTEVVASNSLRRAVALMSKWITSTPWE